MNKGEWTDAAYLAEEDRLQRDLARAVEALAALRGSNVFALPMDSAEDTYIIAAGPRSDLLDMLPDVTPAPRNSG